MDAERKARLGARHTCFSCGTRFYDMNKPDPICPKCGTDQREVPAEPKPKPKAKRARKKAKKKAINPALIEEEEGVARSESIQELDLEGSEEIQVQVDDD